MEFLKLRAELEADRTWRQDEIRFFQNQGAALNEIEKEQFRRAIILLLYAHFEGFCKVAFILYINAINEANITCGEAHYAIAAAALADLFNNLRNPDKKSAEFRHQLPDDTKLHRFAREREFIERTNEFEKRPVKIQDTIIDTESNLKPIVLRKILYRLGLPDEEFKVFEGEIFKLLGYRNQIAHGQLKTGIKEKDYEKLKKTTYKIMDQITIEIMEALKNKCFLR